MILKTNMVTPGKDLAGFKQYSAKEAARATLEALGYTVPPLMPGIAFLSGGQASQCSTVSFLSRDRCTQTTSLLSSLRRPC